MNSEELTPFLLIRVPLINNIIHSGVSFHFLGVRPWFGLVAVWTGRALDHFEKNVLGLKFLEKNYFILI
jgi:hypothetical protein